jgi:hypothetical protein
MARKKKGEANRVIYRWGGGGYYVCCMEADIGVRYANATEVKPDFKKGFQPKWNGSKWENVKAYPAGTEYIMAGGNVAMLPFDGPLPEGAVLMDHNTYYVEDGRAKEKGSVWFARELIRRVRQLAEERGHNVSSEVLKREVACDVESRLALSDLVESEADKALYYLGGGESVELSKSDLLKLKQEMFQHLSEVKAWKWEKIRHINTILSKNISEADKIKELKSEDILGA